MPPVNVMRVSVAPERCSPRAPPTSLEWRAHLLERLRRQAETTADPVLADDYRDELAAYLGPGALDRSDEIGRSRANPNAVVDPVPAHLPTRAVLTFISTTTVFGTPVDVTLSELAIEAFFPANAETAEALAGWPLSRPSNT